MEKESQLLDNVRSIFMRYGIKSVTMDDIARELKISKKTLYQFVVDKPELVSKVMQFKCNCDQTDVTDIIKKSKNAVDELLNVTQYFGKIIREIHPSIHYDLEKYYPEAWQVFDQHKKGFVLNCITTNLKRGIKEGLYRDNLNVDIIARIFVARIDMVFDSEIFPPSQFNFGEVHLELMRYHIRGIASEKGIKYLLDKLKNEKIKF
ncbi:MAG: TetR/AcrR family transcriptional regulator [Bacteroidota bacterium]